MRALSYVQGAKSVPLLSETIGANFDRTAAVWSDRDALVVRHQGIRWTYGELRERIDALAAGLLDFGLRPGDRTGIWAPNTAEWVLAQFATAKAGLILVNINPAYRVIELEHALCKAGCSALITAVRFKNSDYLSMLRRIAPELSACHPGRLQAERLPALRTVIHLGPEGPNTEGMIAFDEVMRSAGAETYSRLQAIASQLQCNDPINVQFTSGTTGAPKGATLTHRNLLNNAFFSAKTMGLRTGDRLCIPVPLYHCFGMVLSNLACVTQGATMVFPSAGFEPLAVLQTVEEERCTHLHGVPTMFVAEVEHPELSHFELSTLRGGIMAGAPCPIALMRRVIEQMHLSEITICYGMTETSPVSFQSSVEDPVERRVSTVGRIHPHVEVKLIDPQGSTVLRGTAGELLTRGYSVMAGYWDDPAQTASSIDAGGWMHSGDLAVIDDEGYCSIVGRLKDMAIRGGENIYPREIEEFLSTHPKIETAQVFGVPDPKYGEELCAWVRLRSGETMTESELRHFCHGRIAHFKTPKYVCFVDEFPMTATGKIQKFAMREKMIAQLGLSGERPA